MSLIEAFIMAVVTGFFSTAGTVIALRVDVKNIKGSINEIKSSVLRAHERIDRINRFDERRSNEQYRANIQ